MDEAKVHAMPWQIRHLFATIMVFSVPNNPRDLWDWNVEAMAEDFRHSHPDYGDDEILSILIDDLQARLENMGKQWASFAGLPDRPDIVVQAGNVCRLIAEETSYSDDELRRGLDYVERLNADQRYAFDQVLRAARGDVEAGEKKLFFLDGPGGTGKSYVYEALASTLRAEGKIVLVVASSGIAACILTGGRTAHSRFRIPLNITEESVCTISVQSDVAKLMKETCLIVWDEAPMSHRHNIEAVDRTLKDLTQSDDPFGGKVCLCGGDFRQILPVVERGGRAQTVRACLKRSSLWPHMRHLSLRENMRIANGDGSAEFAQFLLRVGDGREPIDDNGRISLPEDMLLGDRTIEGLIKHVFGRFDGNCKNVILTTKNKDVDAINDMVADQFPGEFVHYYSADSLAKESDIEAVRYPTEFLNTLRPKGMAPHKLSLKPGMPIMLLRNINASVGLCNGTRLRIKRLYDHTIDAEVLHGKEAGKRIYIPRILMEDTNSNMPFRLVRKQFPVRPCFAMTINKSQGQTLDKVGVSLLSEAFSHGQLYVALSRVTRKENIKVLIEGNKTRNVVYRDALL
jgi:hypothetical protein